MKTTNIIQRLCLFLFILMLAAPAWSVKRSFTWSASDRSRKEVEGTRISSNDNIVTVSWSDCKTGPALFAANRNWEMKKGSTVTITCTAGWRVRAFYVREQLKNANKFTCTSNSAYQGDASKKIEYYDATDGSITLYARDEIEFAKYTVEYVENANVMFDSKQYEAYSMSGQLSTKLRYDGHSGNVTYHLSDNNIATLLDGGTLDIKRPGKGVLTATFSANEDYCKAVCSVPINVKRDQPKFTGGYVRDYRFTNGNGVGGVIYNIFDYMKITAQSGRPFQFDNPGFSITSDNPSVVGVANSSSGKLTFGGSSGTATITIRQKETDYYSEVSSTLTLYVIRSDQDGTVLLKDRNEYKLLGVFVDAGYRFFSTRLEADIDLGTELVMIGSSKRRYQGTLDGHGHTLTFDWNVNRDDIAPILYAGELTIKNLNIKGKITTDRPTVSGLIAYTTDRTFISNCVSDVDITTGYKYKACFTSGMVAYNDEGDVTFNDCIVKGKIISTKNPPTGGISGFVGYQDGKCTLNNCLYLGSSNTGSPSGTFAYNCTINNCYYQTPCGEPQGKQVTAEQFKSGELAYLLQNKRTEHVWGQELGKDNKPLLTDEAPKHVYKVDFICNGEVKATRYTNSGKTVIPPTVKELLGDTYNPQNPYTLNFSDGFSASTIVNSDHTVDVIVLVNNIYEIASKDNWNSFCNRVNNGQTKLNAKMIKNVDLGSEIMMVGTSSNPYAGTFDGQNHTLTLNWNTGDRNDIAPFRNVKGATIKNLHTEGTITSSSYFLAGLIDEARGTNTISGCASNVNIKSTYASDRCGVGGLISYIYSGANVAISDCLVKGNINAKEAGRKGMGGFVYGQNGTCTLTNCLYVGTNNAENNGDRTNTFAHNATLNNCHYLKPCGNAQGEQVTVEQLKSGEMTHKLQAGRTDYFWGQTLVKDNEPLLTNETAKHICKVDFTHNGNVVVTRYTNVDCTVILPTVQEIIGKDYNAHHYYSKPIFANDFNSSTAVTADKQVAITITEKDYYEIASSKDWEVFCEIVCNGQTDLDVKMTADVDLAYKINMVGGCYPYTGTFDGQGHTLTFHWNAYLIERLAPFYSVKNVTIKNLHVKGKLIGYGYRLSGLINEANGTNTISNCSSDMDIAGTAGFGGMIHWLGFDSQATFNDCLVKETHNVLDFKIGGFVYAQDLYGICILNNCLYVGTPNTSGEYCHTFGKKVTLNNCYYLNACGEAQGEQVTEEQLASGEVAKMLQAGRNDQCYWAQVLGEMPSPYREVDKAEANYVYYNKENNSWTCDDFRLTDGKPLPIGIDFTATKATYERDLSIGKATLCLPYELPVQGFNAYTISEKQGNADALRFTPVTNKLEAYKPYLLIADGTVQLGGENIEVKAFNDDKLTTPAGKYKFVGTVIGMDNASATAANAYILQEDGKFHKVTTEHSEAMLPAYRAYIQRNDSGAKQLSVVLDGETTGIGDVTNEATDGKNGPVYDLQGRRVADRLDDAARHRLPAGVYIVGGRKVIVK